MVMTRTFRRAPALAVFAAAALLGTTSAAARADALVQSLPHATLQAAPLQDAEYVPFGTVDRPEAAACEGPISAEEQLGQAAVALLVFFKPADFPPDLTQKTTRDVHDSPTPQSGGSTPPGGGPPPSGGGGGGPQTPEPATLLSGLIGIGFAGLYRALKRRKE